MYFENFPIIQYDFNFEGTDKYPSKLISATDITVNVRLVKEILENIALYDEYDIVEGESPEIIAEKFYGSAQYHWIVMLANQRWDYIGDWPLPYVELEKYVAQKYGEANINAIHHYINSKGQIVNSDFPGAVSISNLDHEITVNESKRRIKIISPKFIQRILTEFNDIL